MGAPVVHFEILGKKSEKLCSFYGDLFDWEINADNGMNYGLIQQQGESGIGGGIGEATEGQRGHVTIYVEVEDLQVCLDKVESIGGKTVVPHTEIPDMVKFAMFQDLELNLIGIVQS